MDVRQGIHSVHTKTLDTQELRNEFLTEEVFVAGEHIMVYSHIGRIVADDIMSIAKTVPVGGEVGKQLDVSYFLEHHELGVINIGGAGMVTVDGRCYEIGHRDALHVGKGVKEAVFASIDTDTPAKFYYSCAPAHMTYPTEKVTLDEASPVTLGDDLTSSRHTINKYFVPDILETCQLNMGLTELAPGNLWNTMPHHTHERRVEVYFYFNMDNDACVPRMMRRPQEARHTVMHNKQAVISPGWSIRSGAGTKAYTSVRGIADENQIFDDMDRMVIKDLRQLWA